MDSLHTMLRSIRESEARRDHLDIFREFLGHLDRIGRGAGLTSPRLRGEVDRAQRGRVRGTPDTLSSR